MHFKQGYKVCFFASLIAFIYIFSPSLKFLYRNELVNILPTILFIMLYVTNLKKINKEVLFNRNFQFFLVIFLFFGQFLSMFKTTYVEYVDFIKLINLFVSFIVGYLLCGFIDKKILNNLATVWCVALCIGYYFGFIKFGVDENFNHLNYTLPIATVSTGLIFRMIQNGFNLNTKSIVNVLILLLFMFNLFTSGSRSAIIMPFIGVVLLSLIYFKHISIKRVILFSFITTLMLILTWNFLLSNMSDYFIQKVFERSIDSNPRYSLYLDSIEVIIDNPFGVWFGGFSEYIPQPYPHNIFLEIAYNSGLLFAFVFFIIILSVLMKFKDYNLFIENINLITWFTYLILAWNFSNSLLSSSPIFFLLGCLIGVQKRKDHRHPLYISRVQHQSAPLT